MENGHIKLTPAVSFALWDAAVDKHSEVPGERHLLYRIKAAIKDHESRSWDYVSRGHSDRGTLLLLNLCRPALTLDHLKRETRTNIRTIQRELLRFLSVIDRIASLNYDFT